MSEQKRLQVDNRLIERLTQKERKALLSDCETVELSFGQILCEPRKPLGFAYFPLTGFISLVTTLGDHQPMEVGLIGNEGMLGVTLMLGVDEAPLRAIVQGNGSALKISASRLRRRLLESTKLQKTLNRYLYVLMDELSTSAACNQFHELQPRMARWLLMTHDRAHSDHFYLTHAYLAGMLGVRRSGITVAAGALQRDMIISYTRGEISVLDRKGLEEACCECYETTIVDYGRLLA
ncbi:MAG: Crp/Fnr family transcriptional regulator [Woeseiaceae bacterium]|nr:Crp/Fnr family transcriptional regulator [Woeseiaceae bacterium]